jgi:hypothetical protein
VPIRDVLQNFRAENEVEGTSCEKFCWKILVDFSDKVHDAEWILSVGADIDVSTRLELIAKWLTPAPNVQHSAWGRWHGFEHGNDS